MSFTGCSTDCPACGLMTPIEDGTYEIANSTFRSFRALDVPDLLRFQAILAEAKGKPPVEVAEAAKDIDPAFGKVVQVLQALGGLPLLIALIGLYIQYAAYKDDNADQDAVLSELKASNANQELLIEGMRELIEAQSTPAPQPYSGQRPSTNRTPPSGVSGSDRAAKRRAWKQAKKASKDNSIKFRR